MSRVNWPRVVASGALWTVVYNLVWGGAWFALMQREWIKAVTAIGKSLPFTGEVWFLWVVLTLPIGVAIMAYTAGRAHSTPAPKAAVYAGLLLWVLMTLGMAGWGLLQRLSLRVMTLDSTVNLVAMLAASLGGGWSLRNA